MSAQSMALRTSPPQHRTAWLRYHRKTIPPEDDITRWRCGVGGAGRHNLRPGR